MCYNTRVSRVEGDQMANSMRRHFQTVQQGRNELALGWGIFSFCVAFDALGINAPTNPGAKALEPVRGQVQASTPPLVDPLP